MYRLKTLHSEHAQKIVTLEKKCFSKPWGLKECLAVFAQKHFTALGLWTENTQPPKNHAINAQYVHTPDLVAYISFYHVLDEMEILNIAVDPLFQRQGHGTYILGKALEKAKEMQLQRVVLDVRISNTAAIKLYEKFSFVQVGTRKKYYTDTMEDACIYTLAL